MILQPATDAEEGEVMALLHLEAQLAEEAEGGLRIALLAKLPAQIQQPVHFIASDAARSGEKLVDNVQRAPPMAMRGSAFRPVC